MLVPTTALRIHPVETLIEKSASILLVSMTNGVFIIALFSTNALAANLRHSHIWLSFGPKVEHILNSPAQHQIHHSICPDHFNHNYSVHFSLWDWMFGTLITTTQKQEDITFGLGERANSKYRTMSGILFYPFKGSAEIIAPNVKHYPSVQKK